VGVVPKVLKVKQTSEKALQLVNTINVDMSYGMIGLRNKKFITSNRNQEAIAVIERLKTN
jgi:hypothetical protein